MVPKGMIKGGDYSQRCTQARGIQAAWGIDQGWPHRKAVPPRLAGPGERPDCRTGPPSRLWAFGGNLASV